MIIRQGDIFLAATEDENGNQRKVVHPQVVIQDTLINNSRVEHVVACEISTNMKKAYEPGSILLERGEGNLQKQSIILPSHISSIRKDMLGEYIGHLEQDRIDQVFASLKLLQSMGG